MIASDNLRPLCALSAKVLAMLLIAETLCLYPPLLAPAQQLQAKNNRPEKIELRSPDVTVPMQLARNKPVVEVMINGKGPFKLFLDTGAAATVLNKDLADELQLPVVGTIHIGDPANPQAITANQVQVEQLSLGGAVFSKFKAVSWDRAALYPSGGPRGVLGMPLFADLLLTLNYPQGKVDIRRGELPSANGNDILTYKLSKGGTFRIPVSVAGINIDADLDTGASGGLGLPKKYIEQLPLAANPVEIGRGRTVNGEFSVFGAKLNGVVKIGGHSFENPDIEFNEYLPGVVLGYRFLRHFVITIDQKNQRARLIEAPSKES